MSGLIIAAPASGSGKTVVTLGLLRALVAKGVAVASLKVGPDYIDPAFHESASGRPCRSLDLWAMRPETCARQVAAAGEGSEMVVAEGVMGLFDGSVDERGSTADVAAWLGWPVVLVVDVSGQGASVAALVEGFARHRDDVRLAGVIFNRVAGARHADIVGAAMKRSAVPVVGSLPRSPDLALPERHLGLVQAHEHEGLDAWTDRVAEIVARSVDLDRLVGLAAPYHHPPPQGVDAPLAPLGQRIAVARDRAFAFVYRHVLEGWREAGAAIGFFSPLADEAPDPGADAVYLPGGYPELHAGRLARNKTFLDGLRGAAAGGAVVYGECGGYMVLGQALTDPEGKTHAMAGLLPVHTSFAERRLHLGYRDLELAGDSALGPRGSPFRGHEFHYSRIVREDGDEPLFTVRDALGAERGAAGCRRGSVMGSYIHLVDRVAGEPESASSRR